MLILFEFDLSLVFCKGTKVDPLRGENDWLRVCAAGFAEPEGGVKMEDLGLVVDAVGPGDGEGEPLSKGLLRRRAPPAAVVDMIMSFQVARSI